MTSEQVKFIKLFKYMRQQVLKERQADTAAALGCSVMTISNWESGRTFPRYSTCLDVFYYWEEHPLVSFWCDSNWFRDYDVQSIAQAHEVSRQEIARVRRSLNFDFVEFGRVLAWCKAFTQTGLDVAANEQGVARSTVNNQENGHVCISLEKREALFEYWSGKMLLRPWIQREHFEQPCLNKMEEDANNFFNNL